MDLLAMDAHLTIHSGSSTSPAVGRSFGRNDSIRRIASRNAVSSYLITVCMHALCMSNML
ncbi:hypothetical protein BJX61DRAFT_499071, partial [Aspergillus egyptiacus]